ncbi:MAG: hypothetical protein H7A37_03815 [Chlamydiales bacterium]|nr:hypothetical protein [Chlamydiia bacterium]MCP5507413.1 hypothetical protein [Chlamydiales bacterium]
MPNKLLIILLLFPTLCNGIEISSHAATIVGHKIWKNECGGKVEALTTWNEGEEFASIGIGHFIWYPKGYEGPFDEQFPKLLQYFENEGVSLPLWLKNSKECPWTSRECFNNDLKENKLTKLRLILLNTVDLQVNFMVNKLSSLLPRLLAASPEQDHDLIKARFARVLESDAGIYAILDYINFKGDGTNPSERYDGKGWGLLQVLQTMDDCNDAIDDFVTAGKKVLNTRIERAPPERNEGRWMKGWYNRLDTYLDTSLTS